MGYLCKFNRNEYLNTFVHILPIDLNRIQKENANKSLLIKKPILQEGTLLKPKYHGINVKRPSTIYF